MRSSSASTTSRLVTSFAAIRRASSPALAVASSGTVEAGALTR
jgi:hypothetical protein